MILEQIAKKYRLSLIYVFGSQVETALAILEGQSRPVTDPLSDIDIGVVFEDGLPPVSERPDIYADLYNDLHDIFRPHRVDLVFLEEHHSVFQANVLSGKNLYCRDEETRFRYEEDIARRAADFRPVLERYYDEILEDV